MSMMSQYPRWHYSLRNLIVADELIGATLSITGCQSPLHTKHLLAQFSVHSASVRVTTRARQEIREHVHFFGQLLFRFQISLKMNKMLGL